MLHLSLFQSMHLMQYQCYAFIHLLGASVRMWSDNIGPFSWLSGSLSVTPFLFSMCPTCLCSGVAGQAAAGASWGLN